MQANTRVFIGLFLALALAAACSKSEAPPPSPYMAPPTTVAAAIKVTDIELGRALGADKRITDKTDSFKPNETIYLSITTEGSSPSARITADWTYQDGQAVKHDEVVIAPAGTAYTEFHIAKPGGWPAGDYKVEVMLNGASAGSKTFKVSK